MEFIRHRLLNLTIRVCECRMEEAIENVFGDTSCIHGRIVPGRNHELDSVLYNDTGDSAGRFVEDETEVILAQETVVRVR